MTSHRYAFDRRDLVLLLGGPLVPIALFAVLMQGGAALGWLPAPRPALDVDRTLLIHQIEAARSRQEAEIVLVGDSSCLMDISAKQLSALLGCRVLNLGTHSYLDLLAYAQLLREHVAAHPRPPRAVVLLLHPEALRRVTPETYHSALFQSLLRGEDLPPLGGPRERIRQLLGLEAFRNRCLSRWLPAPLPGAYGRTYGFSRDLEKFLMRNQGSVLDPEPAPLRGNSEYRLAPQIEAPSRLFRAAVPAGTMLVVGITPVPAEFAGRAYPGVHGPMLHQWSQWLQADAALVELPCTLPDRHFARVAHLNQDGVRLYTEALARVLKQRLP
ncbi:MAG: hypothetical protein HZA90_25485 [Verrucomicrobia bacterium]|nr:hypothetical protein [Verrucomicrobiota bacterium]